MTAADYRIRILPTSGSPESKLADVEILLPPGPFGSLKLVGCSIWRSKKDDPVTVLIPSRSYSTDDGVRYIELLRPEPESDRASIRPLKQIVRQEYERLAAEGFPRPVSCAACGTETEDEDKACAECGASLLPSPNPMRLPEEPDSDDAAAPDASKPRRRARA